LIPGNLALRDDSSEKKLVGLANPLRVG